MPAITPGGGGGGHRRRRRRAPSKQHLAHVQARQYGSPSQSRRAARTNRRAYRPVPVTHRAPAFRPLPKSNAPFRAQRQQAHRKAARAERRIAPSSAVPHIPLLPVYTPKQSKTIRQIYKRAGQRAGVGGAIGLYGIASSSQRRQMTRVGHRVTQSERAFAREFPPLSPRMWKKLGYDPSKDTARAPNIAYHSPSKEQGLDLAKTKAAGVLGTAGINLKLPNQGSFRFLEAPPALVWNLGRASVESPGAVFKSSLRTGLESITGIPEGVKLFWHHPGEALKQIGQDYERRYGSILSDPAKFREMVKKEYGLTPYLLDASAVASVEGSAAGVIARTGAFGKLADLPGVAGRAAKVLHEATTRERPRLRFSGGEAGTRAQATSRNLFVARAQHGLDRRRAAAYRRQIEKAGYAETSTGRLIRQPGREALPDRIPGLRPGRGEVVGRGLREVGPLRPLTGRIPRDIGETKSVTRLRMLTHRGRVLHEIHKTVDKLSKEEKVGAALMLRMGVRPGRESLAAIRDRLEQITTREAKRARAEGGFSEAEVEQLQAVLDNPERYLTTRAKAAANKLKDIQFREAANDPSLNIEQELNRRLAQQGGLLNVPRKLDNGEAAPDVGSLRTLQGMIEDTAAQQRKAKVYKFGTKKTIHFQKQANAIGKMIDTVKAETRIERRVGDAGPPKGMKERRGRADVSGMPLAKGVAKTEMARHGIPEEVPFAERVRRAARDAKLDEPAYWMSHTGEGSRARLAAVGSGLKATERNREFKGEFQRIGAEDVSLDTYVKGVERNIKRRFQWQMVSRNIEVHAYEWSRNNGQGVTFAQAEAIMRDAKHRIDPDTVDFIPATITRKRAMSEAGLARGRIEDTIPEGETFREVHEEVKQRKTWQQLSNAEVQGAPRDRYFVVPKEVGDTLEAATKPSSGAARTLEIVLKQKPSRIMLGAFNVPWLGFQIASNAFLTGIGGGLKPWDIYGAYKFDRWLKHHDREAHEAWEAENGVTHGHHFALDQPHVGDQVPFGVRHLAAYWRAYRHTKVGRIVHKGNPFDAMFKTDEAQNNFFRRTLFYSDAKRGLYRKMGNEWKAIDKTQQSLIDKVFRRPPNEMLEAYIKNADNFEQHAKHVRDMLGDYTRFSNAERRYLSANVMFYGYLRFSLRFAFYTMPVQHPIMADIMGNLGRLGAQDIKQLFGVPSNYSLPPSMLSPIYSGTRADAKAGRLQSFNIGRMNPFLNTVTQMESPLQAVGLVSPLYQDLLDQAITKSSFTGREWRIKGKPTPDESTRPPNYFGSMWSLLDPGAYAIPGLREGKPRNRILEESLLSMAFPYRLAEQTGIPGTRVKPFAPSQSDDALLWSPRPMHFKGESAAAGVARSRRKQGKLGLSDLLLQGLALKPKPTAAPQIIKHQRELEAKGKKKKRRKGSLSGGGFSGGGFSGGGFSGGGFSP